MVKKGSNKSNAKAAKKRQDGVKGKDASQKKAGAKAASAGKKKASPEDETASPGRVTRSTQRSGNDPPPEEDASAESTGGDKAADDATGPPRPEADASAESTGGDKAADDKASDDATGKDDVRNDDVASDEVVNTEGGSKTREEDVNIQDGDNDKEAEAEEVKEKVDGDLQDVTDKTDQSEDKDATMDVAEDETGGTKEAIDETAAPVGPKVTPGAIATVVQAKEKVTPGATATVVQGKDDDKDSDKDVVAADPNQETPPEKKLKKRKKRKNSGQVPSGTPPPRNRFRPTTELQELASSAKKNKTKQSEDVEREREAQKLLDEKSKVVTVEIHPGMIPWTREVEWDKDKDEVKMYRVPVNHNQQNPSLMYEITNNMLSNVVDADLSGKYHQQSMGTDMELLLTYNKKVSPSDDCHLHVVKKSLCKCKWFY